MANKLLINVTAAGDNQLVAAVPGAAIRVLAFTLTFSAAVNATFASDLAGAAVNIGGPYYGATGNPVYGNPDGVDRFLFATAPGKALNLKLSSAVPVGGNLIYEVV